MLGDCSHPFVFTIWVGTSHDSWILVRGEIHEYHDNVMSSVQRKYKRSKRMIIVALLITWMSVIHLCNWREALENRRATLRAKLTLVLVLLHAERGDDIFVNHYKIGLSCSVQLSRTHWHVITASPNTHIQHNHSQCLMYSTDSINETEFEFRKYGIVTSLKLIREPHTDNFGQLLDMKINPKLQPSKTKHYWNPYIITSHPIQKLTRSQVTGMVNSRIRSP